MIIGDRSRRGDLQERAVAQGVLHLHQLHKVGRLNNPMEIVEALEFDILRRRESQTVSSGLWLVSGSRAATTSRTAPSASASSSQRGVPLAPSPSQVCRLFLYLPLYLYLPLCLSLCLPLSRRGVPPAPSPSQVYWLFLYLPLCLYLPLSLCLPLFFPWLPRLSRSILQCRITKQRMCKRTDFSSDSRVLQF